MLLVGSRAARALFPDFRDPRGDIDLIVLPHELSDILSRPGVSLLESHFRKKMVLVSGVRLELELAEPGESSFELYPFSDRSDQIPGVGPVSVATPEVLLLLKKSHVFFPHAWEKTFRDYQFLRSKVGSVPACLRPTLDLRIEETKSRLKFRDRDFDVTNDEFFDKSAHAVRRFMPHDEIHETVRFYDVPMFKRLKDDQDMAQISFQKFQELSFTEKIRNMQEEVMVLAIERHVLPDLVDGIPYSERRACQKIMRQLCHNFLPFAFREFAVDHFDLILAGIPQGFSQKAVERVKNSR